MPTTLRDVCQAIADIELNIHSSGTKHAILAVGVLYEELERLGYQTKELREIGDLLENIDSNTGPLDVDNDN